MPAATVAVAVVNASGAAGLLSMAKYVPSSSRHMNSALASPM